MIFSCYFYSCDKDENNQRKLVFRGFSNKFRKNCMVLFYFIQNKIAKKYALTIKEKFKVPSVMHDLEHISVH